MHHCQRGDRMWRMQELDSVHCTVAVSGWGEEKGGLCWQRLRDVHGQNGLLLIPDICWFAEILELGAVTLKTRGKPEEHLVGPTFQIVHWLLALRNDCQYKRTESFKNIDSPIKPVPNLCFEISRWEESFEVLSSTNWNQSSIAILFIPPLIPAGIHGIPGIPARIPGIRRNDPEFRNSGGIQGGIRLQFGYQSHNFKCTYIL
jgi:hypothetical protein